MSAFLEGLSAPKRRCFLFLYGPGFTELESSVLDLKESKTKHFARITAALLLFQRRVGDAAVHKAMSRCRGLGSLC